MIRDIDGNFFRSSTEYFIGLSTMPWMISRCLAGSIVGMPLW